MVTGGSEQRARGSLDGMPAARRRLPTPVVVLLGVVVALAAVGGGIALGRADHDAPDGTVRRITTTTAGAVAGGPTTTLAPAPATTADPPDTGDDGVLEDGFYVIIASAAPSDAGSLVAVAAEHDGARRTDTSRYTSLPAGDERIGQPPYYLPTTGVAVVALGPYPLDFAVRDICGEQLAGDCIVRQLTTRPVLDPGPAGLTSGMPDGLAWPSPDHPPFPFPTPSQVRGRLDGDTRCADDDDDDGNDGNDGQGCLATLAFRVDVQAEGVTVDDVIALLERDAPATGWIPTDGTAPGTSFGHSCGGGCHALVELTYRERGGGHDGPRIDVVITIDDH